MRRCIGRRSASPRSTRSGLSASCTSTRPWNRRANSGWTSSSSSRWAALRARPVATSSVCRSKGAPARSSSVMVAAIAVRRGSASGSRDRQRGRLDDDRCPAAPRDQRLQRLPREREAQTRRGPRPRRRRSSRSAAAGASTTASSSASTTASREPYASGTRLTMGSSGTAGGTCAGTRASARNARRAGSSPASRQR